MPVAVQPEPAAEVLQMARDGRGVVTLTLNRPQAFNALNAALLGALQEALDQLAADDSVRVVLLAAAGKAFCAGHDLKEMHAQPSEAYTSSCLASAAR